MDICIFGAASNTIDKHYIDEVEKCSEQLAKRGHNLVFGAGTHGEMGAAARGFKKGNGKVTGIVPEFFKEDMPEVLFTECDELIYTETMRERKGLMEDKSDAFIITPGGIGTFEEFFEVLTLKQLGRHTKPIAVYNINGYYDSLVNLLDNAIKGNFLNEECKKIYLISSSFDEIIAYIEENKKYDYSLSQLKNG